MADIEDIRHLLRRTEFVARPERVSALGKLSFSAAVANVLSVPTADRTAPVPRALDADHRSGTSWGEYQAAVHWWTDRMAFDAKRPIQERLALFWHGHFCSHWQVVDDTRSMMRQNAAFRAHGLGNLRTLAHAVTRQPAMLRYLDNDRNRKASPNQNFSRELLELFVLGVGNYTEQDVEAATAAWTGHGIDRDSRTYTFRAKQHDTGVKTFLGQRGHWDGPDIIDLVLGARPGAVVSVGPDAGQPAPVVAARFLSRKLWRSFVSETPSDKVIKHLGQVLVSNNFEIAPWVGAMLRHDSFRSAETRAGLVRTPIEYIVALLHASGRRAAEINPEWFAEGMGQALFGPPNVSGWGTNGYWVNSSALGARAAFANHLRWKLTKGRDQNNSLKLAAGSWKWSAELDALPPEQLIDTLAGALLVPLSRTSRDAMVSWAAAEQRKWGPDWWRSTNALLLLMIAPEMSLA